MEEELKLKFSEEISVSLGKAKDKNSRHILYKIVCNIALSNKVSKLWITRDLINTSFKNTIEIGKYKLFKLLKRHLYLSLLIPYLVLSKFTKLMARNLVKASTN